MKSLRSSLTGRLKLSFIMTGRSGKGQNDELYHHKKDYPDHMIAEVSQDLGDQET